MDPKKALEALDRKLGRTVTLDDWERIGEKVSDAPATVTDDDLIVLRYFAGDHRVAEVRALREKALNPTPSPVVTKTETAHRAKGTLCKVTHDQMAEVIVTCIKAATSPLVDRIKALETKAAALETKATDIEARAADVSQSVFTTLHNDVKELREDVQQLQARPELKYYGVYRDDAAYVEGSLVTRKGGLWIAERATGQMPGTSDSGWRLIVRSGTAV